MIIELVICTSLILGIFGEASVANCRDDDHAQILTAFKSRDGQTAAVLMTDHLRQIEGSLDLTTKNSKAGDLVSLFSKK